MSDGGRQRPKERKDKGRFIEPMYQAGCSNTCSYGFREGNFVSILVLTWSVTASGDIFLVLLAKPSA